MYWVVAGTSQEKDMRASNSNLAPQASFFLYPLVEDSITPTISLRRRYTMVSTNKHHIATQPQRDSAG